MEDLLPVQISKDLPTGQRHSLLPFVFNQTDYYNSTVANDRSNSLTYCFVGPTENFNGPSLAMVVQIFLDEADKHIEYHSGLRDWPSKDSRTVSPKVDQDKVKLLLEKLVIKLESSWQQMNDKKIRLNEKYLTEKQKYFHYFDGTVQEEFLDKLFKGLLEKIVLLPYQAIGLEITRDKGLYFEIRSAEMIIHLKLILSDPVMPKAFFAIYGNTVCLDNGVGPINDIIDHLLDKNAGVSRSAIAKKFL